VSARRLNGYAIPLREERMKRESLDRSTKGAQGNRDSAEVMTTNESGG
jgi:hypothetical protein